MFATFKRHGFRFCSRIFVFTSLMAFSTLDSQRSAAQSQPALQITSPADGTIVPPGQTLTVTVTSPGGVAFSQVALIGEDPIPSGDVTTSMPAQFSIIVRTSLAPRKYQLTAIGQSSSGQLVVSQPISIDVERSDMPVMLAVDRSQVSFQSQGQQTRLKVSASFSGGTILDVTESSKVAYASSNTNVATVDTNGIVTAIGAGSASVTSTYVLGSSSLQAATGVSVPPPVLSSSPASLSFGNQQVGSTSPSQQLSLTNVGKNQGLKINSVATTGDFTETDNCVSTSPLSVGSTCTINVKFVPTATGSRSGAINVTNSFTIVPFVVQLAGTGTASAPAITSLNPQSGPVGTFVTITGTNFGSSQGTSTVTFNGTLATPTNWTNTSITAPVPSGATTGNVVVTVGGVASNGVTFTVVPSGSGRLVQHTSIDAGTTTSATLAFTSNNTAGNWIGVCIRTGSPESTTRPTSALTPIITVTDSNGNTYRRGTEFIAGNGNILGIFYAENIAGGANAITVSVSTSSSLRFAILEYSGVATSNSLDVIVSSQGSGLSPNSGPATTTASGDLLLGVILTGNAATFTAGSGYTTRESVPAEPYTKVIVEDQIQKAAGTASATASLAASDNWAATLAAFKPHM